ncbi:MAG TPA: hypothetical protein DEA08_10000 [Planctomycetes bacterium]|nr:hypothetical protein [Planctomycetota bacterium]
MRAAYLSLVLIALAGVVHADDERPPRWVLRTSEPGLRAFLWGPAPARAGEEGVSLVEYTGRAAAMLRYPKRALVVTLTSDELRDGRSTKGARLTLLQSGKEALKLEQEPLPKGSPLTPCARSGRLVLVFAAEALSADGLRLELPRAGKAPLKVEFFRVSRAAQDAERELRAWSQHTNKIRHVSSILPYLDHPSVASLRQRDEAVLVPLLLRELARTAPRHDYDAAAVPRFAVWTLLRETRWAKANKLGAGDPDEVLGVLSDWRRANAPRLEGLVEPRKLVKSPEELAKTQPR